MPYEIIPLNQGYRYTSRPRYRVARVETASGDVTKNAVWAYPLHRYSVTIDSDMESNVPELLDFYHAHGGEESFFLFKDWADYKSVRVDDTPAHTDQVAVSLTATTFQLVKDYTYGAKVRRRLITKPKNGSVLIGVGGTLTGSGWTLDPDTGIVTFASAPGAAVTWGGEFYVYADFDGDFPIDVVEFQIDGLTFTINEQRG